MRYDHHPEPATAYCIECEIIEGMFHDVVVMGHDRAPLEQRVERAMMFRVGGDVLAVSAKDRIREIEGALKGYKTYAEVLASYEPFKNG